MGCWTRAHGRWQEKMERMQEKASQLVRRRHRLHGLERQQRLRRISRGDPAPARRGAARIPEFLERLRHAKDKAEFDQFMADRRRRPEGGPVQAEGS